VVAVAVWSQPATSRGAAALALQARAVVIKEFTLPTLRAEAVRAPRSRQCSDLRPQTSGGWRPRAAARLRLPPVGLDARQEIVVQNLAMMALRMLALALAAGIASAMSTPPDTSLATLPVVYYGANWNRTQENIDVLARFQMVILMQVALASIVASTLSVSLSSLRALD
jgi:hypothetical protein